MNEDKLSMDQAKPSYWAVLPAAVRYDPELPPMARLIYAEISALTESRGYCYASNDYFLQLYGMAERTLQRHLKALEDRGYIRIQDGSGGRARRKIYAGVNPLAAYPDKNDGAPRQKCHPEQEREQKRRTTPQSPPGGRVGAGDVRALLEGLPLQAGQGIRKA